MPAAGPKSPQRGGVGCADDAPSTAPRSVRPLLHKWNPGREGRWNATARASPLTNMMGLQLVRAPLEQQPIKMPTEQGSTDLGRFILHYPPGTLQHATPLNHQTRQFEMQRLPSFVSTEQARHFLDQNDMMTTTFRADIAELMTKWFRRYEDGPDNNINAFRDVISQFIEAWASGIQLGEQHVLKVMSCVLHSVLLWMRDGYYNGQGFGPSSILNEEDEARAGGGGQGRLQPRPRQPGAQEECERQVIICLNKLY